MNKKFLFIVYTRTQFSEPPRARHQFCEALSIYYDVIFIEANKIGSPRITKKFIHKNYLLLSPRFPIDFRIRYRIQIINELYQKWLFRYIQNKWNSNKFDIVYVIFDHTANIITRFTDKYIYYVVQREQFIKQLAAIESGANYPAVTDRQVKNQKVPKPNYDEQAQIAEILDTCDKKVLQHAIKKEKLKELFHTLLQQLMTGQTRVNNLEI